MLDNRSQSKWVSPIIKLAYWLCCGRSRTAKWVILVASISPNGCQFLRHNSCSIFCHVFFHDHFYLDFWPVQVLFSQFWQQCWACQWFCDSMFLSPWAISHSWIDLPVSLSVTLFLQIFEMYSSQPLPILLTHHHHMSPSVGQTCMNCFRILFLYFVQVQYFNFRRWSF